MSQSSTPKPAPWPKVTIITVTYNSAATLGETIESVNAQSYSNLEHIIVDGGSKDETLTIVQEMGRRVSRCLSEPDRGIYDAMNKGIALASGDFIGFLNSDDVFASPRSVELLAQAVANGGSDFVYGDLVYFKHSPIDGRDQVVRYWKAGPLRGGALRWGWMPPHPTLYVRTSVIRELGGFDSALRISADYEFILRLLRSRTRTGAYVPHVLVKMRLGGASNQSLQAIRRKSSEDLLSLRRHRAGGVLTLVCKNLRKFPQLWQRTSERHDHPGNSSGDSSSPKLRILVISQHYWPESLRINDVAPALAEQGCEVVVLTGKPNYPDGRIFAGYRALGVDTQARDGCTIVRVPLIPRGKGRAWELTLNYLSFIVSGSILGPLALRKREFDVVFVYGTSPILQALVGLTFKMFRKAPVVTWVQDLWPESLAMTGFVTDERLLSGVGGVVRWIYRRSDLVLVQSVAFLDPIRILARPVPVAYQPNPGERSLSVRRPTAAPALTLSKGFNIVFAGNLGTVQALETVIEAARLTGSDSGIRWVFLGSGARLEWLQEQARLPGLSHVQIAGRFDSEAMPGILQQADVLLVSLIGGPGMRLTVPSKIQAYLSVGKPILASIDGEGGRLIEEAGAGLVCPAQNAPALAGAALQLRDMDAAERQRMAASGQSYFEAHFAPDLVARQLIGHLQRAAYAHEGVETAS